MSGWKPLDIDTNFISLLCQSQGITLPDEVEKSFSHTTPKPVLSESPPTERKRAFPDWGSYVDHESPVVSIRMLIGRPSRSEKHPMAALEMDLDDDDEDDRHVIPEKRKKPNAQEEEMAISMMNMNLTTDRQSSHSAFNALKEPGPSAASQYQPIPDLVPDQEPDDGEEDEAAAAAAGADQEDEMPEVDLPQSPTAMSPLTSFMSPVTVFEPSFSPEQEDEPVADASAATDTSPMPVSRTQPAATVPISSEVSEKDPLPKSILKRIPLPLQPVSVMQSSSHSPPSAVRKTVQIDMMTPDKSGEMVDQTAGKSKERCLTCGEPAAADLLFEFCSRDCLVAANMKQAEADGEVYEPSFNQTSASAPAAASPIVEQEERVPRPKPPPSRLPMLLQTKTPPATRIPRKAGSGCMSHRAVRSAQTPAAASSSSSLSQSNRPAASAYEKLIGQGIRNSRMTPAALDPKSKSVTFAEDSDDEEDREYQRQALQRQQDLIRKERERQQVERERRRHQERIRQREREREAEREAERERERHRVRSFGRHQNSLDTEQVRLREFASMMRKKSVVHQMEEEARGESDPEVQQLLWSVAEAHKRRQEKQNLNPNVIAERKRKADLWNQTHAKFSHKFPHSTERGDESAARSKKKTTRINFEPGQGKDGVRVSCQSIPHREGFTGVPRPIRR